MFDYSHVEGFPTTGYRTTEAYGHDGKGTLVPTQTGFIYTPHVDDNEQVNVNYIVTDAMGMQDWQDFLTEFGEFSQFDDVKAIYQQIEVLEASKSPDLTTEDIALIDATVY